MITIASPVLGALLLLFGIAVAVLVTIFVLVPLLKGVGWIIANVFKAIGFLIAHVFEFVGGMISDALRLVGTVLAVVVLVPLTLLNVVIGRWSAAGHFASGVKREASVFARCIYRILLRRPLKLLYLHGILEGLEQRVPEAMAAAPGADRPSRRLGTFTGYTIVGSIKGGGSGAKLYIAEPGDEVRGRVPAIPPRVVIKSFALSEGSSLPQIVRESRALESARRLGLVFEHGMDESRFWYVMPYHPGDHLGIVTRQLHAESGGTGLAGRQLGEGLGYVRDIVRTLEAYHLGGLWHKDVKPENVIVHDGGAHLVDLGLVTPLRSAMTLTTHGTEYFRDPEMVRQALRGVKVHQVDGAKFDVYAAGAVLYFVVENDFPAHGALSRFARRSPDAVRWIIRRAMADYGHRYGSANEMLADLEQVAAARDPFAVKPADLPSMRGVGAAVEPDAEESYAAAPAAAAAATTVPPRSRPASKPRLRVVDWWTGSYAAAAGTSTVEDAARSALDDARGHLDEGRRAAREQLRAARTRVKDMRSRAKGRRTRTAPGGEQPRGALAAIGVVTMLVLAAGLVVAFRPDPVSPIVVAVSAPEAPAAPVSSVPAPVERLLVLPRGLDVAADPYVRAKIAEIVKTQGRAGVDVRFDAEALSGEIPAAYEAWHLDRSEAGAERLEQVLHHAGFDGVLILEEAAGGGEGARRFDVHAARCRDLGATGNERWLLLNDHPARLDPRVDRRVARLVESFAAAGRSLRAEQELEVALRGVLPPGAIDPSAPASPRLSAMLAEHGLDGVVVIQAEAGEGPLGERVRVVELAANPG